MGCTGNAVPEALALCDAVADCDALRVCVAVLPCDRVWLGVLVPLAEHVKDELSERVKEELSESVEPTATARKKHISPFEVE